MDDDSSLLADASAGDAEAVAVLFDRHWRDAWETAFRITGNRADADDVAQDAFLRSIRELRRFDGRSSYQTWLTRIAINASLDVVRSRSRTRRHDERRSERIENAADDRGADARLLYDAVQRLPDHQRAVVVLRYWLDLAPEEIASILLLSPGTVHSRLARGLKVLRGELEASLDHAI